MNRESVEFLLRYNRWANTRLLQALSGLSQEQWDRNLGSSYGSIRETLAHLLFCEEAWLMRWKGISPKERPDLAEVPDAQAFAKRFSDLDLDVQNFYGKISDEALQEVISFEERDGKECSYPLLHMMLHLLHHSTQHRGQLVTMLRQVGGTPEPIDLLDFVDAQVMTTQP